MNFFCAVATAPLRAEPNHRAEMVSQLLFGEHVLQINQQNNWLKVTCNFDGYEGWVEINSLMPIPENIPRGFKKMVASSDAQLLSLEAMEMISIIPGCEIYCNKKEEVFFNNNIYTLMGETVPFVFDKNIFDKNVLIDFAYTFLNTPYLWGGKSFHGADCSGFTQTVFKLVGIRLPRDAWQQAEVGKNISFTEVEEGDLAFFKNEKGKIAHVGICLDEHEIIHCSTKVRMDTLTNDGIWNKDLNLQTHDLALIKRL